MSGLLLERLHAAGLDDVTSVEPATGGLAATAGIATRGDGARVFVKSFDEPPADDVFLAEADGLDALRSLGAMATPEVLVADRELLVLSMLAPRPVTPAFWEGFAHDLAAMHATTVHDRFGWQRDNWLGRRLQSNAWTDDGHEFNPFLQPAPDTTLPLHLRPIGGLGIHFVRNLLDTCDYQRREGKNIVTVTKALHPPPPPS